MSALVLDAGAFVALERADHAVVARLKNALRRELDLRTSSVVVAQVWRRSGGRQANLARFLQSVDVRGVDQGQAREAGELLGRAGREDVVDALLVNIAATGDRILTSDPEDILHLVAACGRAVRVIPC